MIFLIFISLVVVVIVALMVINGLIPLPTRIWKKIVMFLISISLVAVVIVALRAMNGFFPLPTGIRHFFHLAVGADDLYDPIIIDNFPFWKEGFSKTYLLKPKYLDIYELGILLGEGKTISSKYKFKGRLRIEFLRKGRVLSEYVVTSIERARYAKNDMARYQQMSLMDFEMPLRGRYKDGVSLRLTVLKPDQELKGYGDSLRIYVAVSAVP